MKKRNIAAPVGIGLAAVLATMALVAGAHAQSSLGIGTNEAVAPSTGLFAGLANWINVQQQHYYRMLTGAMKGMRDDQGQMWVMVGLSFAYGAFHAAGPGHGKAVISTYLLANEVALKRGIALSFVSAFMQAAVAITLMALIFFVLRGSAINMTNATHFLEIVSYALITAFGAWLLWRKAAPHAARLFAGQPAASLSAAAIGGGSTSGLDFGHVHDETCRHGRLSYAGAGSQTGAARFSGDVCADCGHAHMPDPQMLAGERFNWRAAWSAVVAVGLRPCTGALIVLSFAFLNGLWVGGVMSVLAMALGTAITVSLLATLAVTAKDWAVTLAGNGRAGNRVHAAVEIGGAALVFILGLSLLLASLAA